MAKRIKIKDNTTGSGMSKADRKIDMALGGRPGALGGYFAGKKSTLRTVKRRLPGGRIEIETTPIGDTNKMSRPSSTRKKRVKEGSRKFIGPRQLSSELNEDYDSVTRRAGGLDRDLERGVRKIRGAEDESEPISNNDEIYRRIGEMILRSVRSRRV